MSETDDQTPRRPPTIELAATEVDDAADKPAAGADISDAAVPTGVVSRDGMTPVTQSAAATAAITTAPMSALAICDVKRRPDRAAAGALEPAVACSAVAVVPASAPPVAGLSVASSTSVAANSMVGGRRGVWSSVSLMCPY